MKVFNKNKFLLAFGGILTIESAFELAKQFDNEIIIDDITLAFDNVDEVREARSTLLAQADILINKAEDKGQDSSALRQYRQDLRDVTKQTFDFSQPFYPFPALPSV